MVARPFSKQRTPSGVTQGSFVSHGKHCSQTRESGLPSTCSTSLTLPSRRPAAPLRSSMVMLVSTDRKSTRLNSSHLGISYAVFFLQKHDGGHAVGLSQPGASLVAHVGIRPADD